MRKIYLLTVILALALCLAVTSHALASGPDSGNDELVLSSSVAHTFAIFEENEAVGLSRDDYVGSVWVKYPNSQNLWNALQVSPEWSFTYQNSAGGVLSMEIWELQHLGCEINLVQYPADGSPIEYTVTCTWGGYTETYSDMLSFETLSFSPSDFTVDNSGSDTLHLQVGKDTTLHLSFDPADFNFSDRHWVYYDLPSGDLLQELGGEGFNWRIKPLQAGNYACELGMLCGNILLKKPFTLEIEMPFSVSGEMAHTFALFEDDETIGLSHANPVGYVMIDHYDYWADRLEGVPQWSLTYETDKGAAFAYEAWEYSGNEGFSMGVSQYPGEPVTVHYTVTCTWGDYSQSYESSLAFVNLNSIPDSFTVNGSSDTLHLYVGRETTLQFRFDPSTFSFSDRDMFSYSLPSYDFLDQIDVQGHNWVIKPLQTGTYSCELGIVSGNIELTRPFTLIVGDTFTLSADLAETFADFYDNADIGLGHDSYIGEVMINDYDFWRTQIEGAPQWTVTAECETVTEGDVLAYEVLRNGRYISLSLAQYPRRFPPVTYTVTCTWGGVTQTYNGILTFTQPDGLPTGIVCEQADENGVIHLDLLRKHTLTFSFLPDTFAYGSHVDLHRIQYPGNYMDRTIEGVRAEHSYSMDVVPYNVGEFDALVKLRSANILMQGNFHIVIEAPDHDFSLRSDISSAFASPAFFTRNSNIAGLSRDDYMGWVSLNDANFWETYLTGEPEWSLTYQNTKGGKIRFDADHFSGYVGGTLHVVSYPSDNSPIAYTLTCDWDGYHVEYNGELRFETPDAAPVDILLDGGEDSSFSMTLGMERALHFIFKTSPNSTGSFYIDGIRLLDLNFDETYLQYTGGQDFDWIVNPLKTGTSSFSMGLKMGNVKLTKQYTVQIVDEPVPYFEDELYYLERYIAPVQDPHANRTVTITDLIRVCPDNYDELLAAYGPDSDANWTLEHVSGPSFTYNLQHKVEQFIYVMMRGEPNGPGTSTYRLTCSWGGHSGSVLILTNFKETDLPSGQTVNGQKNRNVYFMKRGESQVFSFGLQNSAGFVPVDVVVNYNPNQLAVEQNGLDVTFTPLVNGAIPINVSIRTRADMNSPVCNVRVVSEMALLVTEDGEWTSLDLPRSLTTIDEEAFMGTSANVVTLQGRVETIGPRAFANSPSLMSVNLPASLTTIDPSAFDEEVILVAKTEDLFFWAVENNFNVLYIP